MDLSHDPPRQCDSEVADGQSQPHRLTLQIGTSLSSSRPIDHEPSMTERHSANSPIFPETARPWSSLTTPEYFHLPSTSSVGVNARGSTPSGLLPSPWIFCSADRGDSPESSPGSSPIIFEARTPVRTSMANIVRVGQRGRQATRTSVLVQPTTPHPGVSVPATPLCSPSHDPPPYSKDPIESSSLYFSPSLLSPPRTPRSPDPSTGISPRPSKPQIRINTQLRPEDGFFKIPDQGSRPLINLAAYDPSARAAFGGAWSCYPATRMADIFNSPVVDPGFLEELDVNDDDEYDDTDEGESEDEIDRQLARLGLI